MKIEKTSKFIKIDLYMGKPIFDILYMAYTIKKYKVINYKVIEMPHFPILKSGKKNGAFKKTNIKKCGI